MEIYIQVVSDDDGSSAWWNAEGRESYLMDGKELEAVQSRRLIDGISRRAGHPRR